MSDSHASKAEKLGVLALRLFDGLTELIGRTGLAGAHYQWKRARWRGLFEARVDNWVQFSRGVNVQLRMCRTCRSLVDRREARCPDCGASMSGVAGGGLGRVLSVFFPDLSAINGTMAIAFVNVAMMGLVYVIADKAGGFSGALYALGSKWVPDILQGQWWRLVMPIFLHGGLLHLVFNTFSLINLGPLVEGAFGRRKFFLIYLTTGVVSFVVSSVLYPTGQSIGASGAIFGLLGFCIVFGHFRGGAEGRLLAGYLMRWLLLGVVMIALPGVDHAAHFGGAAAGGLLALLVSPGEPRPGAAERRLNVLAWAALIVVAAAFSAAAWFYPQSLSFYLRTV